jgi:glucose/arabinose dehydrogenase
MKPLTIAGKACAVSITMFSLFTFSYQAQAQVQDAAEVDLNVVATGLTAPVSGVAAPGDASNLYVVDQIGIVHKIDVVTGAQSIFLDVRNLLVQLGLPALDGYDERGLLGLAFHPDFATNHLFYTFTTEPPSGSADFTTPVPPDHDNVIREWSAPAAGAPVPNRVVLRIENPQFNHTGGAIAFGPDRMLYISLGDGGGEDDQDCQIGVDGTTVTLGHGPNGTGQDPNSILASILRINPNPASAEGTLSRNSQYRIPADNPRSILFASGPANVIPEVWAKGLRNPFRFSFDSVTNRLIAGDVGQNNIEEIDIIAKGGNYGWRLKEGTSLFDPRGCEISGFNSDGRATQESPSSPNFAMDPIGQYRHTEGRAVIAGFVYRGTAIPGLREKFVFGDYSQGGDPRGSLFTLDSNVSQGLQPIERLGDGPLNIFVLGFGQDSSGELYVLGNATGIPAGNTGVVQKIVPSPSN